MSVDAPVPGPGGPGAAMTESEQLHRRSLGVPSVAFFIVAASAPLTVVAGGHASTYLVTGNAGVPLLFLLLGAMLGLFVAGYSAMSHHITNAGAFYAYVSRGIGKVAGVGTAFLALIAYNSMQIGISGLFGAAFSGFMAQHTSLDWQWYTWVFVAIAVIASWAGSRVDLNAKVLAIFLTLEIIVVAVFDLVVAADPAPQGITSTASTPTSPSAPRSAPRSHSRWPPSSASSRRRSTRGGKNPRRTVARAT